MATYKWAIEFACNRNNFVAQRALPDHDWNLHERFVEFGTGKRNKIRGVDDGDPHLVDDRRLNARNAGPVIVATSNCNGQLI